MPPGKRFLYPGTKGQGTLEMAIVFILVIIIFGGIVSMWNWGNKEILRRSVMYNLSRKAAGEKPSGNYEIVWPIWDSANPSVSYKAPPSRLNESDVFLWNK